MSDALDKVIAAVLILAVVTAVSTLAAWHVIDGETAGALLGGVLTGGAVHLSHRTR